MSEFSGWDKHRRKEHFTPAGTINLASVFLEVTRDDDITDKEHKDAIVFLNDIELMQRINSRQAAAIAIATARALIRAERTRDE